MKRGLLLGAVTTLSTSALYSEDLSQTLRTLKILQFHRDYQESKTLESTSPTLVYLYDIHEIDKADSKLTELFSKAHTFGYSVQKKFVGENEDANYVKEKLSMSNEELDLRLRHHSNFVFVHGEKLFKPPMGINTTDVDSWVAKCQSPIIKMTPVQYFGFCRRYINDDEAFIIVVRNLNEETKLVIEKYSRYKYKVPFISLDDATADRLQIKDGVTIVRPFSKYDGDFDINDLGKLKHIHFEDQDLSFENLDGWVKQNSTPKLSYCDSFDKIYPMFNKIYNGPLKAVYVLTSQMNPNSAKYQDMLKNLLKIQEKHAGALHIVILPNDEITKKLGVLRDKKLRMFRKPEVRFLDFSKMIGTEESQGKFPIIDCSDDKSRCGELVDTYYTRKNNFDKKITYESLEKFVDESLKGEYAQYYETDTLPCSAVRKLCARDFAKEVIDYDGDVIVEFYGKYCPGCKAFKNKFNEMAKRLKNEKAPVTVAKICVDYNMVPEISGKKPYTPIFWFYKKGQKEAPIEYKGKYDKEELYQFIRSNLTQEKA